MKNNSLMCCQIEKKNNTSCLLEGMGNSAQDCDPIEETDSSTWKKETYFGQKSKLSHLIVLGTRVRKAAVGMDSSHYSHWRVCVAPERSGVNASFLYKLPHVPHTLAEVKNHHHTLANEVLFNIRLWASSFPFCLYPYFLVPTTLFLLHPHSTPLISFPCIPQSPWLDNDFQWTNCDNLTVCFDVSWDLLSLKMLISLIEKRKDKEGFYARYSSH